MRLALNVWRRQRQLTKRMRAFYVSRMVQAVFMGVLRGSMFWMIPRTAAGGRLVLSCERRQALGGLYKRPSARGGRP
jgi:hypothetical protein